MLMVSTLSKTLRWEGLVLVSGYAKGKAMVLKPLSEYKIEKTA